MYIMNILMATLRNCLYQKKFKIWQNIKTFEIGMSNVSISLSLGNLNTCIHTHTHINILIVSGILFNFNSIDRISKTKNIPGEDAKDEWSNISLADMFKI